MSDPRGLVAYINQEASASPRGMVCPSRLRSDISLVIFVYVA